MKHTLPWIVLSMLGVLISCNQPNENIVASPDQRIRLHVFDNDGTMAFQVFHSNTLAIDTSSLGVVLENDDLSNRLSLLRITRRQVSDEFSMF